MSWEEPTPARRRLGPALGAVAAAIVIGGAVALAGPRDAFGPEEEPRDEALEVEAEEEPDEGTARELDPEEPDEAQGPEEAGPDDGELDEDPMDGDDGDDAGGGDADDGTLDYGTVEDGQGEALDQVGTLPEDTGAVLYQTDGRQLLATDLDTGMKRTVELAELDVNQQGSGPPLQLQALADGVVVGAPQGEAAYIPSDLETAVPLGVEGCPLPGSADPVWMAPCMPGLGSQPMLSAVDPHDGELRHQQELTANTEMVGAVDEHLAMNTRGGPVLHEPIGGNGVELGTGTVLDVVDGHVGMARCDASLSCAFVLETVDGQTVASIPSPPDAYLGAWLNAGRTVAPGLAHAAFLVSTDDGTSALSIRDLDDGEEVFAFPVPSPEPGHAWTPEGEWVLHAVEDGFLAARPHRDEAVHLTTEGLPDAALTIGSSGE
ncbi:hypothetical protein ER308_18655 [Egibacter rhizosphaerae]|uniref:Uncharacterized protein n=1 Tax=Egibacter rhizosphaerae TaxID=1670831 RepID=A0A411YJC1_9ACTN|nr:hypothetical protein [Egibacter rhizosphaerae]QBI21388.1 hypothetical protein ER308_18655 [Egibacter rhizosphaerae]